jgi:hypothetical protein
MAEAHREEIARLEALYATHPGGRVFVHLAEAYRKSGEHDRARAVVEEGLARHADAASGYVVLGRILTDVGDPAGAQAAFGRVLELDAGNLVALRGLGELAWSSGRLEEAREHYRELLSRNPSSDEARAALTELEQTAATVAADGGAGAEAEPADAAAAAGQEPDGQADAFVQAPPVESQDDVAPLPPASVADADPVADDEPVADAEPAWHAVEPTGDEDQLAAVPEEALRQDALPDAAAIVYGEPGGDAEEVRLEATVPDPADDRAAATPPEEAAAHDAVGPAERGPEPGGAPPWGDPDATSGEASTEEDEALAFRASSGFDASEDPLAAPISARSAAPGQVDDARTADADHVVLSEVDLPRDLAAGTGAFPADPDTPAIDPAPGREGEQDEALAALEMAAEGEPELDLDDLLEAAAGETHAPGDAGLVLAAEEPDPEVFDTSDLLDIGDLPATLHFAERREEPTPPASDVAAADLAGQGAPELETSTLEGLEPDIEFEAVDLEGLDLEGLDLDKFQQEDADVLLDLDELNLEGLELEALPDGLHVQPIEGITYEEPVLELDAESVIAGPADTTLTDLAQTAETVIPPDETPAEAPADTAPEPEEEPAHAEWQAEPAPVEWQGEPVAEAPAEGAAEPEEAPAPELEEKFPPTEWQAEPVAEAPAEAAPEPEAEPAPAEWQGEPAAEAPGEAAPEPETEPAPAEWQGEPAAEAPAEGAAEPEAAEPEAEPAPAEWQAEPAAEAPGEAAPEPETEPVPAEWQGEPAAEAPAEAAPEPEAEPAPAEWQGEPAAEAPAEGAAEPEADATPPEWQAEPAAEAPGEAAAEPEAEAAPAEWQGEPVAEAPAEGAAEPEAPEPEAEPAPAEWQGEPVAEAPAEAAPEPEAEPAPAELREEPAAEAPGDAAPEPEAEPAPAKWQGELVAEAPAEGAPEAGLMAAASPAQGLETETMADLFRSQGFADRAAEVYRALLLRRPGDERLQAKLEVAEAELRNAAEPVRKAAEDTGDAWIEQVAAGWTPDQAVPAAEPSPYAWAEEPEDGGATHDDGAGAAGPPIASYLQRLVSWHGADEATADGAADVPAAEPGAAPLPGAAAAAPGQAGGDPVTAAFDEWYGAPEPGQASGLDAEEEDEDLAMFRAWLQSLKK